LLVPISHAFQFFLGLENLWFYLATYFNFG
jgi:hypothetical protein